MTDPRELVARAARNNADLCDVVARSHGVDSTFGADAWAAPVRTPPLSPDAVTLVPGVAARALLERIDDSDGASVKDSFFDLDLAPHGYRVLFDAQWIHRPTDRRDAKASSDPEPVTLVADDIGSFRANASDDVVGVTNAEPADGASAAELWRWLVAVVGHQFPGLDVVGYESGAMLDAARSAGLTTIGPLRIWIRD